eukprot:TRINITY_DN3854_c0_g1_i2.p1 TRINITY_DN3854_c0_g1~~TRINITY_DN3854_c0_g1_i2.p1  ORF type:complete len:201 (+),score=39.88 TRINITY_DN3854_c0_g1_i2:192-794(+)
MFSETLAYTHHHLYPLSKNPNSDPNSLRTNKPLQKFSSLKDRERCLFSSSKLFAVKSPKGFGPPVRQRKKTKKKSSRGIGLDPEDESDENNDDGTDVIPEIVTNRMIKRIGVFVGVPVAIGLTFFPAFYYMKVFLKWNVPDWLPFTSSALVFGSAALGITYGIVSSSWDPLREGSLLGWTEAQRNWPVFWQSVWDKRGKR